MALSTEVTAKFDDDNYEVIVGIGLKKDVTSRTAAVRTLARALAPRGKTGDLKRAIEYDVDGHRLNWTGTVYINEFIAPHGVYVAFGTKGPITSPTGGFMRFNVDGRWIKTKSVAGQERQDFLPDALDAARY